MAGSLYVVSTPIGNLDDITVRAINTLKSVGLVAAEDTRRTGQLLRHFGIVTPTTSLHEHNENQKIPQLLRTLTGGVDVALVSDAGTPMVADPGQRFVSRAIAEGIKVVPIPGASAVLAALAASGYPADEFVFAGFAPSRSNDRKQWLARLAAESRTVVFFEAPHRVTRMLSEAGDILGDRPMAIARELTKIHEETIRTTAREAAGLELTEKGEFAVVLAPCHGPEPTHQDINSKELNDYFCRLIENGGLTRRQAAASTAHRFGLSTNDVYARLERLKANGPS